MNLYALVFGESVLNDAVVSLSLGPSPSGLEWCCTLFGRLDLRMKFLPKKMSYLVYNLPITSCLCNFAHPYDYRFS